MAVLPGTATAPPRLDPVGGPMTTSFAAQLVARVVARQRAEQYARTQVPGITSTTSMSNARAAAATAAARVQHGRGY